jgi:hypothetical protein
MDTILATLAWPAVVLIFGLVSIFAFRTQIAGLISRTKKLGKGGIETFDSQPVQPTEEKEGVEEFLRTFDNPLLIEAEQLILKDLKDRKIDTPADREKALIRALAANNLVLHFERVHGLIWASQLAAVRYLNSRDDGIPVQDLMPLYESGKADFPAWYENYPFDKWLGFLVAFNLLTKQDSRIFITVAGREFLKYLIATGKAGPYYG